MQERDWSGGQAHTRPSAASIVYSARLKGELAARAAAAADETISVTRGELHRLIDRLPAA